MESFNSRTREGCDSTKIGRYSGTAKFQFTHPGGVRLMSCTVSSELVKFQFTHPGGVRRGMKETLIIPPMFQFTHPGGVRLEALYLCNN